jgi:hypothetical protein
MSFAPELCNNADKTLEANFNHSYLLNMSAGGTNEAVPKE